MVGKNERNFMKISVVDEVEGVAGKFQMRTNIITEMLFSERILILIFGVKFDIFNEI